MPNEIEKLGKGAVRDKPDDRDLKADLHIAAVAPVDWTHEFRNPEPPNEDQNGSSSCVGQGWSYQHWAVRPKNYCRRDVYAWIYLPGGGAQIRDGGLRIINYGQDTRDNVQDPNPETESGMESRTGLDPNREKIYQEFDSKLVPNDIDSVAVAIRDFKGCVGGVEGTNQGWQDIAHPRPPASGETLWGHCLYFFGYTMVNGMKYIIAKSSWGTAGNTTVHYIGEHYFTTGYTFNPWTLIPRGNQLMNQAKVVKSKTSPIVYVCYPVGDMNYLTEKSNLEGFIVPNPIPDSDSL